MAKPDSPRRRRVLAGLGAGLVAVGTGTTATTAQQDTVTVTLENVGTSAWEVTNVEGDDSVAETGVDNPELTLQQAVRYTFENDNWIFHPLSFRSEDGSALLSQSTEGSFELDSDVNWDDSEDTVSFTVTGDLAAELDTYICTSHSSMEGSVAVVDTQESAASASFSDQSTDGTSVTVDSVRMDDGGFVVIHDSTLLDGEAIPSVVGASEYLPPGEYEDVEVELDDPLTEDDTLIAMPHRDTNGNESYDFVESQGGEDSPYTADGGAVTDDATVTVSADAGVTMSDQESDGSSVIVDSVRVDNGGFVVIHDSTLLDGEAIPSVVGASEYLPPGEYEDVEVELDDPLTEDDTLIAMPHRDTNGNESYDFVESQGGEDSPYLNLEESAVVDPAAVTITGDAADDDDEMDDDEMDDDEMDDGETDDGETDDSEMDDGETDDSEMDDGETDDGGNDAADDSEDSGSADDSGTGFGAVAGIAGLGGLASYAYRKLSLGDEPPTPEDDNLDEGPDP